MSDLEQIQKEELAQRPSEEKRQHAEASKQERLSAEQKRKIELEQSQIEDMTTPKVEDETVNYAEVTRKFRQEFEENKANAEARDGSDIKPAFGELSMAKFEPSFKLLADSLGLEQGKIEKMANELSVILGWAHYVTGGGDFMTSIEAVRNLKKNLGYQEVGETSVKKLYRYIRLAPSLTGQGE